eukprot:TRINITY_DN629_c0_g1_i10.p3 TRINITY_DN629_c0_g1~~TRINITY_DN629_c0_g1_i10.p3  ORF type:complete len:123 (+),score=8.35 TRINITY_DN629_c0_g1_i10:502-870(+)
MDRLQLFCLFITNSLLRSIISSKVYATSKGTTFDADVVQLNTWIAVWVLPALMDEVCRAGVKYYWSTKEEIATPYIGRVLGRATFLHIFLLCPLPPGQRDTIKSGDAAFPDSSSWKATPVKG